MRYRRWPHLLALLAIVIAACAAPGGDDAGDTTTAGTEAPAATETTLAEEATDTTESDEGAAGEDPLVLGVLLPLTGTVAGPGADALAGLELDRKSVV